MLLCDRHINLCEPASCKLFVHRLRVGCRQANHYFSQAKVIDIKNLEPEEIERHMWDLRNSSGRKQKMAKFDVISENPSVQGPWTDELSKVLQEQGAFDVQTYQTK